MNDLDVLKQMHWELRHVDHPPFDSYIVEFYAKLVDRFSLEGGELLFPDAELTEEEEQALRHLKRYEYIESALKHHGRDGYVYHVNLKSKRFFEIANGQLPAPMKDSGKRETFESGAVRDSDDGKSRPDLISAFAIERVGHWMRMGAEKYSEHNWQKGMKYSRVAASLHRHLMKYMQRDETEDNLAAIVANACFLMHYDIMIERGVLPESLKDLPEFDPMPHVHRNKDEPYET